MTTHEFGRCLCCCWRCCCWWWWDWFEIRFKWHGLFPPTHFNPLIRAGLGVICIEIPGRAGAKEPGGLSQVDQFLILLLLPFLIITIVIAIDHCIIIIIIIITIAMVADRVITTRTLHWLLCGIGEIGVLVKGGGGFAGGWGFLRISCGGGCCGGWFGHLFRELVNIMLGNWCKVFTEVLERDVMAGLCLEDGWILIQDMIHSCRIG